jgi:uncharacterized membrane protein
MNEPERSELERLKQRHTRLEQELSLLGAELKSLESRLEAATPVSATDLKPAVAPASVAAAESAGTVRQMPPLIPPVIQPAVSLAQSLNEDRTQETPATPAEPKQVITPALMANRLPIAALVAPEVAAQADKSSLEMRVGTYWLVRIGVVMLLTGLVFFGNYAYQNFVVRFGPVGKVVLLYIASGLLLAAGLWWQRKSLKESLRNYAQVLFAGGLAAVYFTTYAAHHFENLRVIESAMLDGVLLLAWAGFMVWIADRKKSEVLALFAVGLAYYTSVITRVGSFTLYSNLVLTMAAVFFLVRNRWAGISWASLVATYAAYAWWRFFHGGEGWRWAGADEGLWFGASFLYGYWLIFTVAVFLSKHENIAGERRAAFLTFNNGAMFTLFVLTMLQVDTAKFWLFSLSYGVVLLALAEASRRFLVDEPITKNAYLTQGLLLVTIGIISHPRLAGLQLALVLAAESVVLFVLGTQRKNLVLQFGAYIAGALAVAWGIDGLERNDTRGLWLGTTLGAMMAFNAFWAHRQIALENRDLLRPVPAYFVVLAQVIWLATTSFNTSADNTPVVLAIIALALTASIYVLRVREFAVLGQGFLLLAHLIWLSRNVGFTPTPPWWNPILLLAITLGLSHWWQRQKVVASATAFGVGCQIAFALAIVGVACVWLEPLMSAPHWLAFTSLLALAVTAYGVFTRAYPLAVSAQIFLVLSLGQFAMQLWQGRPAWWFSAAPIAALGLLSAATVRWFARRPDASPQVREPLLQLAMIYRWLALVMSIWCVEEYVPARERIWVLIALGFAVFLFAGWQRNREALLFGAAFTVAGLTLFWWPPHRDMLVYAPNLLAIFALLTQQQLARRKPERYDLDERIHSAVIVIGALSVWRFVWCWVLDSGGTDYLTASWSVLALALFAAGIVLRERMYRWAGLAVLATALGRVVVIDVWKLETIYRVLSFMALGIVLLVLGFIYIKFEDKIRRWL